VLCLDLVQSLKGDWFGNRFGNREGVGLSTLLNLKTEILFAGNQLK